MSFWGWLANLAKPTARGHYPVTGTTSGRPTYAASYSGATVLSRAVAFPLLTQFRANVPPLKRATEILAGFVGIPTVTVDASESAAKTLNDWLLSVEYGDGVGYGIQAWVSDLLGQAITYGFAVGEIEATPRRDGVGRLWSYLTPSIGFKSDPAGALQVTQHTGTGPARLLNPETITRVTHGSRGCDPHGETMFLALLNHCQGLLDIHHAHRATWRRNGIPNFHVNWEPPANFEDPDGSVQSGIRGQMEDAWNGSMKSQVMDGQAKDFFSTGKVTVTCIGADSEVMDIEVSNRTLLELIVSGTGIPPFMFGFSWSTAERMSKQQADMLLATIEECRREVEGAVRRVLDAHIRLSGLRAALGYQLTWSDVNLQDRRETAFAEHFEALALRSRQAVYRQLWADGVIDQAGYALEVVGLERVATPTAAPQPLPQANQEGEGGSEDGEMEASPEKASRALSEMLGEYQGRFAHSCHHLRNGKH